MVSRGAVGILLLLKSYSDSFENLILFIDSLANIIANQRQSECEKYCATPSSHVFSPSMRFWTKLNIAYNNVFVKYETHIKKS